MVRPTEAPLFTSRILPELDPKDDLTTNLLPYIFTAFTIWRREVLDRSTSDEVRESLSIIGEETVKILTIGNHNLRGVTNPNNALLLYNCAVDGLVIPVDTNEVKMACACWNDLLTFDNWRQVDIHFPSVAMLDPEKAKFLPKIIRLGEFLLEKRFNGRFLLPRICDSAWAEHYYRFLAPYYEKIIDKELKKQAIDILFAEVIKDTRDKLLVLDLGCGTGLAQEWKPDNVSLLGIDICEEMLVKARERGEKTRKVDIAEFDYQTEASDFRDGAIMSFVDFYLSFEQREKLFQKIAEHIKEGAKFVFDVYEPVDSWQILYQELLIKAGFSNINFFSREIVGRDGMKKINFVVAEK